MKTLTILIITVIITVACTNKNQKSDAFGNFESLEVFVASEMQGKLLQFPVQEGDVLKKGFIAGVIDTIQLSLKRDQLIAQRKSTTSKIGNIMSQISVQEEQKKTLEIDKLRTEKLIKDNAAPGKQLDDINGKITVIESQISSIRTQNAGVLGEIESVDKQISQFSDQIKRCIIVNPIDGTVLEKYIEPTEIVIPGKVLYKIADLSNMILRVYVSGDQLPGIKTGQHLKVIIDKEKKEIQTIDGIITWIASQAEFTPKIIQTREERVNLVYAVKVSVKNNGYLKIGMPGEVIF